MLEGRIGHVVKPDLDNLAKQLKDAMTRMRFWEDDRQIVRLVCEKRYSETPCWEISARRICGARLCCKKDFPVNVRDGVRYVGKGVRFERIRRITGYLVGTLDRFNNAKRVEERDRVKHERSGLPNGE